MSNNVGASFGATSNASAARAPKAEAKSSIWRRLFDAWVQSYANRVDPEGNVMCEL